MNKIIKAASVSSIIQIVLLAAASGLGLYARSKHLDPLLTDDYQSILVLVSIILFVINIPILAKEAIKAFKKKDFSRLALGLAILNLVLLVLILVFPNLIPSGSCGCAPPGGI
jgi:membrane protease YdiL (CAAX protease family)